MRIRVLTFFCFFLFYFTGLSKSGILDYIISIEIKSTPVKLILDKIEGIGKVHFSYNPELIDENRLVSLNIKNKSIRYGLSLIFDGSIRVKEVGEHIVLLKNENKKEVKAREKKDTYYVFCGNISDELTGGAIYRASVYDVDSRYAVLTDEKGNYTLSIPMSERIRSLYFSRKGYKRKVIVIDTKNELALVNNIVLSPIDIDIEKIKGNEVVKVPQSIKDRALSGALVSYETYQHGENLPEINESRMAQISLVPSVSFGSNLSTNGLIINQFSLNVLAGYSKGVEGFEVGGLANMVNGDVNGCQIGGITNLVAGHVKGVQIAGISNLNKGSVEGVQLAGISSIVQGGVEGTQVSGILSVVKGDIKGVQISGISSIVGGAFDGVQISGIKNLAFKKSYGTQIAGIYNQVVDTLIGSQISGIGNSALKGNTLNQVSGIFNVTNVNSGTQFSGIYNHANDNNGLQIGLINTSVRSSGIAIGLINIVKEGYSGYEISTNEAFQSNVVIKSGVKRLYNSYSFGRQLGKNDLMSAGLGLGTYFDLSKRFMLSVDGSVNSTFTKSNYNSFYSKLSLTIDFKILKWLVIYAGPSVNSDLSLKGGESIDFSYKPFSEKEVANGFRRNWGGAQFGIRLMK